MDIKFFFHLPGMQDYAKNIIAGDRVELAFADTGSEFHSSMATSTQEGELPHCFAFLCAKAEVQLNYSNRNSFSTLNSWISVSLLPTIIVASGDSSTSLPRINSGGKLSSKRTFSTSK